MTALRLQSDRNCLMPARATVDGGEAGREATSWKVRCTGAAPAGATDGYDQISTLRQLAQLVAHILDILNKRSPVRNSID